MSRFEKALDRAQSETPQVSTGAVLPKEAPAGAMFDAAWNVADVGADEEVAAVPISGRPTALRFQPEMAAKLIVDGGADHVVVEQYNKLAASLRQWQLEHGGKVVMIASAAATEGKTLTAINVALTLSGAYQRRVLLVDCDLRRPTLHEAFQIPIGPGVSDIAAGARLSPRALTERLFVVPAGESIADPVAALTSEGMAAILGHGRRDYDWVVLDTPPATMFSDASLLADCVDGAVLLVAAGRTEFDQVTRALAAVGKDRILGVVLNRIDPRDIRTAGYEHYGSAPR